MAVTTEVLWENAVTHLRDLSNATLRQKKELEDRVAELEAELSAVKSAYAAATGLAARDKKAHNAQLSSLNKQIISGLNCTQVVSRLQLSERLSRAQPQHVHQIQDPLVLCVIDGDRLLFHPSHIEQGYQGGRQVAQDFTKLIAQELVSQGLTNFARLSFWVTIYTNKRAVLTFLRENGVASPDHFEAFLTGFSQASPRFAVVDSGPGRDSTEVKVKEHINTYIRFPQTLRVFCGGIDESYFSMVDTLERDDLTGKLVLVQPPLVARHLAVRPIHLEGLFREEKMNAIPIRRPGPLIGLSEAGINVNMGVVTNGGLISPRSESQKSMPSPPPSHGSPDGLKQIDPSKPLHKQNPPPCNEHYLMNCSKGANCKYSHEWLLSRDQLDVLARNAKKAPCNYLKNGINCPFGDKCCWGHVCPSGARCFHLSKGKCWFKGDGMHPAATPSPGVESV
ncbi:uncharacterized protein BXZ73DRAFT_97356 [Epithele typhae]|uniref:uncharacterized protein n=1 Tax=Epithele typhae TaxID=378194 RepID=UPI0020083C72|nr:uncharacterized protein BXZ73DRAFT_97356 [Epithele typhae]KAH9943309.1 hypothetical protein BXZ73DRAFT_97356 [Epithele typhae]